MSLSSLVWSGDDIVWQIDQIAQVGAEMVGQIGSRTSSEGLFALLYAFKFMRCAIFLVVLILLYII